MPTDLAWNLADLDKISKRGIRVMSTFACGGGSSLGYKLAGCEVVAANDIDPQMEWHYRKNLKPELFYRCPIADLLTMPLPNELFDLDILDGSPPCSTFSMAGNREADWGKEKMFREGQSKQVLSDLFFDWLSLVERLKPRAAIAENVKGMIVGRARGYSKQVLQRLRSIGYRPQLFLLNSADCGVPQSRERVFFCAVRKDVSSQPLRLTPRMPHVSAARAIAGLNITPDEIWNEITERERFWWMRTRLGESFSHAKKRAGLKENDFTFVRVDPAKPCPTVLANPSLFHWSEPRRFTFREIKRLGSFPDDYQAQSDKLGWYLVGMSVPPRMTKAVADAVCEQWLRK